MPRDSPDGPTTNRSGQPRCRVSRSASRDSSEESRTSVTSGPSSDRWSKSLDLQSWLGNRLLDRLGGRGSPLYVLTWRTSDTPWGPPICQLRASARRTADSGCSGQRSILDDEICGDRWRDWTVWMTPLALVERDLPIGRSYSSLGSILGDLAEASAIPVQDSDGRYLRTSPMLYCWLMGYPRTYIAAADSVTPSSPSSEPSSSRRSQT